MFNIKTKLAVAAVVAAGAVAMPAAASAAPFWSATGASEGAGTLTLAVGTSTTTCDVAFSGNLTNGATMGEGTVSSFLLGVPAGGSCSTNVPNCTVTAVANTSTPWSITGLSGPQVQIGGINFANTYGGGSGCALNGAVINATGSLTGNFSNPGVLSFSNTPGVTSSLGPALVTGSVEIVNSASGLPVSLS